MTAWRRATVVLSSAALACLVGTLSAHAACDTLNSPTSPCYVVVVSPSPVPVTVTNAGAATSDPVPVHASDVSLQSWEVESLVGFGLVVFSLGVLVARRFARG